MSLTVSLIFFGRFLTCDVFNINGLEMSAVTRLTTMSKFEHQMKNCRKFLMLRPIIDKENDIKIIAICFPEGYMVY